LITAWQAQEARRKEKACLANPDCVKAREDAKREQEAARLARKLEHETKYPFVAYITCGYSGQHINALACFKDTDLTLKRSGNSRVYKNYELSAFPDRGRGLEVELTNNFELRARNSDDTLVLGVEIKNRSGISVFQQQAGYYKSIGVRN
jgi:hypothetical protein